MTRRRLFTWGGLAVALAALAALTQRGPWLRDVYHWLDDDMPEAWRGGDA